ncbi:cupin domain-containing protein [Stappia taiwanensis]|uniref:Cupin domain-containing protein n=1 Tax=Stappia taiwanensis TaxID=992267 RepID=A0A838XRS3_9HYPH|nr:cupin domain-containing protein [Stappia taiwanensis]MBA4612457.1 cupin domain-containing protein [Stappia taiwanensis]GGF05531.1 cupin [Stappia taiwanensis]
MSLAQSNDLPATEPVYVQGGIKRTLLQEVPLSDEFMLNVSIIEVPAGTHASPHTHPGIETGYVLDGEFDLAVEGRPDQRVKVGGSYAVPVDAVHFAKVRGDKTLKVLCFFAVNKSEPLATVDEKSA